MTAPAPEIWNDKRGYFESTTEQYTDRTWKGGKPPPDLSRIRKPTRGHKFGPYLICECGRSWFDDQAEPVRCGYQWGQNCEREESISALCRQQGITRGRIAQASGVSTRLVQLVFAGADSSANRVAAETVARVLETAVTLLYEAGVEVPRNGNAEVQAVG